jgi:hypothetical protein
MSQVGKESRMASKIDALRKLSYAPTTEQHQGEFERQMEPGTGDRGACLLIVAQLENELEAAISSALPKMESDMRREMFGQDGPLATFSRKITMAVALRIIGPKTRDNFRIIRHVRNAFAHAKIPISFETDEVADACGELHVIDPLAPYSTQEYINTHEGARPLFNDVCGSMMLLLYAFTGASVSMAGPSEGPERTKLLQLTPKTPLP